MKKPVVMVVVIVGKLLVAGDVPRIVHQPNAAQETTEEALRNEEVIALAPVAEQPSCKQKWCAWGHDVCCLQCAGPAQYVHCAPDRNVLVWSRRQCYKTTCALHLIPVVTFVLMPLLGVGTLYPQCAYPLYYSPFCIGSCVGSHTPFQYNGQNIEETEEVVEEECREQCSCCDIAAMCAWYRRT